MKKRCFFAITVCAVLLMRATDTSAQETSISDEMEFTEKVTVKFSKDTAVVANGVGSNVVVTKNNAHVSISSTAPNVNYVITGHSSNGSLEIISAHPCQLTLGGVELTSKDGPAIYIASTAPCRVETVDGTENQLSDGSDYDKKLEAAFYSTGPLIFGGSGQLQIKGRGKKKHAIFSDKDVFLEGGNIRILGSAKDGIHGGENFRMNGGVLNIASAGDGIDVNGVAEVHGGKLTIDSRSEDVSAIKCDRFVLSGGGLEAIVTGVQSKAIKTDGNCEITGGTLTLTLSGAVKLEEMTDGESLYSDPAYCKAIDCKGDLFINGGMVAVKHSGLAGKGISVEGNAHVAGGTVALEITGGCTESYTNEDGEPDVAAADALKVDGDLSITGGEIKVMCNGNAADGVTAGGGLTIGMSDGGDSPTIAVTVKGAQVFVSGQGREQNFSNPKAVQAKGGIEINSGVILVATTQEGAEGIESKEEITINGGTVEVTAFDDCINAVEKTTINGGRIYCYSERNDGIDCNGPIEINGGVVVSSGTGMPEEGFDCDRNLFTINGGIIVGTGGATSMPSETESKQAVIIYSGEGEADNILQIMSDSGDLLVYRLPRTYAAGGVRGFGSPPGVEQPAPPAGFEPPEGFEPPAGFGPPEGERRRDQRGGSPGGFGAGSGPMTLVFSSPAIDQGMPVSIVRGGLISGGTEFHGLYSGAKVNEGETIKTLTTSTTSPVTSIE